MDNEPPAISAGTEKTFLAVPFADRDQAKAAGARWDKDARSWYAPPGTDLEPLRAWFPRGDRAGVGTAQDPREAFAEALRQAGLRLNGLPEMDGQIHRVPVEGDRGRQMSGAYVGYLDGHPAGFIENFKEGTKTNWKSGTPVQELSDEDRARLAAEAAQRRQQREIDRMRAAEAAAATAAAAWNVAPAADPAHPYLTAKGIGPGELRQGAPGQTIATTDQDGQPRNVSLEGRLLVPLRDIGGKLWSLQTIADDGTKMFHKGGRVEGTHVVLGELTADRPAIIAEGYATAATIHEATGLAVIAAMNAGNLAPVAQAYRDQNPQRLIIIAGDDDHLKVPEKNVGRLKAEAAASAVAGYAMLPGFADTDTGTDWNDYRTSNGAEATTQALTAAIRAHQEHWEDVNMQRDTGIADEMTTEPSRRVTFDVDTSRLSAMMVAAEGDKGELGRQLVSELQTMMAASRPADPGRSSEPSRWPDREEFLASHGLTVVSPDAAGGHPRVSEETPLMRRVTFDVDAGQLGKAVHAAGGDATDTGDRIVATLLADPRVADEAALATRGVTIVSARNYELSPHEDVVETSQVRLDPTAPTAAASNAGSPATQAGAPSAPSAHTAAAGAAAAVSGRRDPVEEALGQLRQYQPTALRDDPQFGESLDRLLQRGQDREFLGQPLFRHRVAYALENLEKWHTGPVPLSPETRSEMTVLAGSAPGLENERMLALMRDTSTINNRQLIKDIRNAGAYVGQHIDQFTPDIMSQIEALENRARLAPRTSLQATQATRGAAPANTAATADYQAASAENGASADPQAGRASTPPNGTQQPDATQRQVVFVNPSVLDRILGALRPSDQGNGAPWEPSPTPMADRLAAFEKKTLALHDETALQGAIKSGRAALDALQEFRNGEGAAVMTRIREAAKTEPGGLAGVLSEMRDGGRFAELRRQFNYDLAIDTGLAGAYDKAAEALNRYGKDRGAVQDIIGRRPDGAAIAARFDKMDAEIGEAAATTPSRTDGRSMLDDLSQKAVELVRRAVEAVKALFFRSATADTAARPVVAASMSP